jgi:hypothetical protein
MEIGIISTALMITVLLLVHTQLWQTLHLTGVTDWLSLSHEHLWCNRMLCGWTELQWSKSNYCESIHMYKSYRKHFKWGLLVHLLLLSWSQLHLVLSIASSFQNSNQLFTRHTLDLWEWKSTKMLVWESLCVRYPIFLNCWWSPKKFTIYLQSTIKLLLSGFSCLQKSTRLQPILYFKKIKSHF